MISETVKLRAVKAYLQGGTINERADQHGITPQTLRRSLKNYSTYGQVNPPKLRELRGRSHAIHAEAADVCGFKASRPVLTMRSSSAIYSTSAQQSIYERFLGDCGTRWALECLNLQSVGF